MKPKSYKNFLKPETTYLGVDLAKGEDRAIAIKFMDDVLSTLTDEEIKELKMRGFHGLR